MSSKIRLLALGLFMIVTLQGIAGGQDNADQLALNLSMGFESLTLGPLDAFEEDIIHMNDAAFSFQMVLTQDQWNALKSPGAVPPE